MNNAINEVQRQYTYAVQPVKLFETSKNETAQKSMFQFLEQINNSKNNPFHPDVSNTHKGKKLDLLG